MWSLLEPLGPRPERLARRVRLALAGRLLVPRDTLHAGGDLVLGFVLYPYVYMTARALFAVQSANLIEVARTLGAGPLEMFRTVALPLARPALALGLSLALLETLNDIGATEYLGVRTLTVSIYTTWVNRGSLEGAAQIACVMLAVVAFILLLERRGRGARRFSASVKRPRQATPQPLRGLAWHRRQPRLCPARHHRLPRPRRLPDPGSGHPDPTRRRASGFRA